MPITKLPKPKPDQTPTDRAALEESFITGKRAQPEEEEAPRVQILVRCDPVLADKLKKEAKRRGISRQALIQSALTEWFDGLRPAGGDRLGGS